MSNKDYIKPSRTFPIAVLLTLAGGYFDAYTYFSRGGVFANAQTGNIIKLGIQLALGNMEKVIQYMIPILSFSLGILVVLRIQTIMHRKKITFIRRSVLLIEIACCIIVSFIPESEETNIIANTIVSFACAMQMECFKTFIGQVFATTVSTGNLRKAIDFMYSGIKNHDPSHIKLSLQYLFIVFVFIFGAWLGTHLTQILHAHSIYIPAALFLSCFIIITVIQNRRERKNI